MNCSNLKKIINNDNVNLIKLYFGDAVHPQMFQCKIDKSKIQIVTENLKKKYNYQTIITNKYYFENKIMTITSNKHITEEQKLIIFERENLKNIHLQISGLLNSKLSNSEFPCKKNYHLVNNMESIVFKVSDYLKIIINDNTILIEIIKIPNLIKFTNEIISIIDQIDNLL